MELAILNIEGKDTGKKMILDKSIFSIEPNDHSIYLDVKWYLATARQGTSKSKERAEITGSTRKIKKQKGTGTARAGSIKSPLFRGGGTVFGPRPRKYGFKLNKKVKQLARKSALTYKAQDNRLLALEAFGFDTPKTKDFQQILNKLGISQEKCLFLLSEKSESVFLSSRNIPNAKVMTINSINSYDLLNAERIILVDKAVDALQEMYN